ncbi:hypothetical protein [Robiginitalea sp. SC105]|uniref:hypothetical protein n=1 Tax=Robiginitalea sp. SC105 TaxID=2762332 RepID=UPI001639E493|nr:hypothetical protein [Robiginitalea sp. SC105]MBC2840105.1 hypothetical protein [Robiginitalea sp. SC105]
METKPLIHFQERGYLMFPYFIIRVKPALYVQVPLHRANLQDQFDEGYFLDEEEEADMGYSEASLKALARFWSYGKRINKPRDVCLAMSKEQGYFIAKDAPLESADRPKPGPVPIGGLLITVNHEIICINQPHYVCQVI